MRALDDSSPHVVLLALDLLSGPQPNRAEAVERLRREVETLTGASQAAPGAPSAGRAATAGIEWHRAAHALVSLARIAPDEARVYLPRFAESPVWPVRMYAARAAAQLRDADRLTQLAGDPRDNVRDAAIAALKTVAGHDADGLYLDALGRADYQLIMTAANALIGTPRRTDAAAAMLAALARISARQQETSRDVRLTLLGPTGGAGQCVGRASAPAIRQ